MKVEEKENLLVPGTEGMKRVGSRGELIKDTFAAIRSKKYLTGSAPSDSVFDGRRGS